MNSYEGNFDAYSEAVNAASQLKMQSEAEIKRAEEEKAYKENKARQYRSKEQRAADAQKRNRIRELEKEIEDTEVLIFELENAITSGKFVIHKCGDELRVLRDINSLTTVTEDKGSIFQENQTIRVIDYIADNVASVFNKKYIGKISNDNAGRVSLKNDVRSIFNYLVDTRAIEKFSDDDIVVEKGEDKKAVVINTNITIVGVMEKLYMTTIID